MALLLRSLRGLMIYVGIGALFHAILVGAVFEVQSAWTWAWLLAWPIVLLFYFFKFAIWLVIACAVIGVAIYLWEKFR